MDDQTDNQSAESNTQKPERIDELDVFGGFVIKLSKYFVQLFRNLFKNQTNQ